MFTLCPALTSEFLKISNFMVRVSKLSVFLKPFKREVAYIENQLYGSLFHVFGTNVTAKKSPGIMNLKQISHFGWFYPFV